MEQKRLTIFTPAYNRAHTLRRTYESLCRQTCKDFEWLVVDDGSIDGTEALVRQWQQNEKSFAIHYVWKENGGLHTGYNKAIEMIETPLCVCIDSDDYMPDEAVSKIVDCWSKQADDKVAGIIGLDFLTNGMPLGGEFPQIQKCHYYELFFKYHHINDVKFVARTELLKQVAPQPTYMGEKNFNPHYLYNEIDLHYQWILLNENICFVDYQPDGMANNIFRQYLNSPNSFAAQRIQNMQLPAPLSFYLKQYIHLGSSAIIARDYSWMRKAPHPLFAWLLLPFGFLLTCYIRYKVKR